MKKILLIIICLLIFGCAPLQYNNSKFHKRIPVSIVIHVVSNKDQFPIGALSQYPNAVGLAYHSQIWIIGKLLSNGKIRIPGDIIGHELLHILNIRDWEIENP